MSISSIEERANRWRESGDTGASSKTIWGVMMGLPYRHASHPLDGDDLGRCIRLLERIPEWKPRLPEMAAVSPYWAALVENWADLERLAALTAPSPLRLRMRNLLRPIEKADPNVFRLNEHLTIRFGK